MQIRSVDIDSGKTTFHLVALGAGCKVLVRKKFTQKQLLAHFVGRALRKQGHDIRLIPAQFVKPFADQAHTPSASQRCTK
jgi:transposase